MINRLIFINLIAGQIVSILCILALLTSDSSLIDIGFIYVLLSPLIAVFTLVFKKYNTFINQNKTSESCHTTHGKGSVKTK